MSKDNAALFSEYVIDGVMMDSTPADMLRDCISRSDWDRMFVRESDALGHREIVDETADRTPLPFKYDPSRIHEYLSLAKSRLSWAVKETTPVNLLHPISSTRALVAESVLRSIWLRGEFGLEEISLSAEWVWDSSPVGNMAAFYMSVKAAAEYIFDLGLHISAIQYTETPGKHNAGFLVPVSPVTGSDAVPGRVMDTTDDTCLIYIPFDTCQHKLGGSVLGEVLGRGDEGAPEIMDPDYFIDCFEVLHELVEDGLALAGTTVGRGGLLAAVDRILGEDHCIDLETKGIETAYMESDPVRILFAEIPGVIVQVRESDMDYMDSQFLLQDIAYYVLGRPFRAEKSTDGGGGSSDSNDGGSGSGDKGSGDKGSGDKGSGGKGNSGKGNSGKGNSSAGIGAGDSSGKGSGDAGTGAGVSNAESKSDGSNSGAGSGADTKERIRFVQKGRIDLSQILAALMNGQSSEGED